jgi:ferredoxin
MAYKIEFKKSGKIFEWESNFESILDFAEAKGIQLDSGCRVGVCGACKVHLLSGKVTMEVEDALDEEDRKGNMILICTAVPNSDLVIDA